MRMWNDIWNYLRGNQTGKEANRLEREALADPFLYEALEGLTSIDADHEHIVDNLQRKIRQRSHAQKRRFFYWVAAASLLIIGGVALLWQQQPVPGEEEVVMAGVVMDTLKTESGNIEMPVSDVELQENVIKSSPQVKHSVAKEVRMDKENHVLVKPEMSKVRKQAAPVVTIANEVIDSLVLKEESATTIAAAKPVKTPRKVRRMIQPDWQERFNCYVTDSLRYPKDARLGMLEGEVILSVRMDRKGHPARIKIVKSLSPSCDLEAIRLVEDYPGLLGEAERKITLNILFRLKK